MSEQNINIIDVWASSLQEIFDCDDDALYKYIQVGREFWVFDDNTWRKFTVTFIRSNIMFFIYDDEPDTEYALHIHTPSVRFLHPAVIYIDDILEYINNHHAGDLEEWEYRLRNGRWDNLNGKIKIKVV